VVVVKTVVSLKASPRGRSSGGAPPPLGPIHLARAFCSPLPVTVWALIKEGRREREREREFLAV